MVKTSSLVVAIMALAAIGAAAYLLTSSGGPAEPSDEVKSLTIRLAETVNEAKEWVPSTIYLKQGDQIELTVVNGDDDAFHRFAIPELGVETQDISAANGREVVTFTVDKTGTFTFIDPLAPDWDSPQCQIEQEDAGEEEAEGLKAIVIEIEDITLSLQAAVSMDEASALIDRLETSIHELEEQADPDMADALEELDDLAHELGEATTLDAVKTLAEALGELVEELKDIAEEQSCIPPGQIIVEP